MKKVSVKEIWSEALPDELAFWDQWLASTDSNIVEDRNNRLKALERPVFDFFGSAIQDDSTEPIRFLDVGAGPLTTLGTLIKGRRAEVVAIDPLADGYGALLEKHHINPTIRTIFGEGEKLVEQFGTDSFHAAYCANALDHCYEPLEVLKQLLAVVKPTGVVYVICMNNVGEMEQYQGLHQWNITVDEGRPIMWQDELSIDIKHSLRETAQTTGKINQAGIVELLFTKY